MRFCRDLKTENVPEYKLLIFHLSIEVVAVSRAHLFELVPGPEHKTAVAVGIDDEAPDMDAELPIQLSSLCTKGMSTARNQNVGISNNILFELQVLSHA